MENENSWRQNVMKVIGSDRLLYRVQLAACAISFPIILYAATMGVINRQHEVDLRRESETRWILEKYDANQDGSLNREEIEKLVSENYISSPPRKRHGLIGD